MDNLELGYYWVKRYGEWEIAQYFGNGIWEIIGFENNLTNENIDSIDLRPIRRER